MNEIKCLTANYSFIFEQDSDSSFGSLNNRTTCMKITITKKDSDNCVSYYYRNFDEHPDESHVYHFINKFMSDATYREDFYSEGEPIDEVIEQKDIDKKCLQMISKINETPIDDLSFNDYIKLRTNGRDIISSKNLDELLDDVPEDTVAEIVGNFSDVSDQMRALRWIKRGLELAKAIKKIEVDSKIQYKNRNRNRY